METNGFLILNNIIYKIYTTENFDEMRMELLNQLKMIMDFDSADFYLVSNDEDKMFKNPITYNLDMDLSPDYEEINGSRGIITSGKTLIYRETDIIPDDERIKTEHYARVYKANNLHYSLHMVIAKNDKTLGMISLYKNIGKDNFLQEDIFILDMLKDHLSYRIEKNIRCNDSSEKKYTINEIVQKYQLTKREDTVLRLLIKGEENNIICERLVITPNTLKKHILNIYRKIGIRNRVQLFKLVKERD